MSPSFRRTKSCHVHTVEGMNLPSTLVNPGWDVTPWSLPSCNLLSKLNLCFQVTSTAVGKTLSPGRDDLAKAIPRTENPPEATYSWATSFLMVTSLDSVVFGACMDCHWSVSEQRFWSAPLTTTVVPCQSPSTHEELHFHQSGCFSAGKVLVTLPEKHCLWGF